jgi:hypothetical protein
VVLTRCVKLGRMRLRIRLSDKEQHMKKALAEKRDVLRLITRCIYLAETDVKQKIMRNNL